ncbi:hypothetical protein COP1_026156 [Malus domestica]
MTKKPFSGQDDTYNVNAFSQRSTSNIVHILRRTALANYITVRIHHLLPLPSFLPPTPTATSKAVLFFFFFSFFSLQISINCNKAAALGF